MVGREAPEVFRATAEQSLERPWASRDPLDQGPDLAHEITVELCGPTLETQREFGKATNKVQNLKEGFG